MMENKITHFNRQTIALLDKEIQEALNVIKEKYQMDTLQIGNISFSVGSFSGKIIAVLPIHHELANTFAEGQAQYFAKQNGLPEYLINRTFISNGESHTIIRLELKNPKFPIITRCNSNGKNYKFTVTMIKEILERNEAKVENDAGLKIIHNSVK